MRKWPRLLLAGVSEMRKFVVKDEDSYGEKTGRKRLLVVRVMQAHHA